MLQVLSLTHEFSNSNEHEKGITHNNKINSEMSYKDCIWSGQLPESTSLQLLTPESIKTFLPKSDLRKGEIRLRKQGKSREKLRKWKKNKISFKKKKERVRNKN